LSLPRLDSSKDIQIGIRSGSEFLKLDLIILSNNGAGNTLHYPRKALHRLTYRGSEPSDELITIAAQLKCFEDFVAAIGEKDKRCLNLGLMELEIAYFFDTSWSQGYSFYRRCTTLGILATSTLPLPSRNLAGKFYRSLIIQTLSYCFQLGETWIAGSIKILKSTNPEAHFLGDSVSPLFARPLWELQFEYEPCRRAAANLLNFVALLLREVLPYSTGWSSNLFWCPAIVTTREGGRGLTFRPIFQDVVLAVPDVLVSGDYASLAQCWALQPTGVPDEFSLLGKVKITAPREFGVVYDASTMERCTASVFGPLKPT
jgi:hypothetical protein